MRMVVAVGTAWMCLTIASVRAVAMDGPPPQASVKIDIVIQGRQFEPATVTIPVGRAVVLTFRNHDVELHAFVPIDFLRQVPVHVDTNGAPQFDEEKGFVRVLIPSGGLAEVRFVPRTSGRYVYRCDLPGHQMVGQIVIE